MFNLTVAKEREGDFTGDLAVLSWDETALFAMSDFKMAGDAWRSQTRKAQVRESSTPPKRWPLKPFKHAGSTQFKRFTALPTAL